MRALRVGVVGAGPAGLAAALFLARRGYHVTIYERFQRAQPVGSGLILQITGLTVLERLGLRSQIERRGARIDRLFGSVHPSGRVVLDVRYASVDPGLHGLAVHRAALFEVLGEAVAQARIALVTGFEAQSIEAARESGAILRACDGRASDRLDFVVHAGGARSPLRGLTDRPVRREELPFGALWATLPWRDDGFAPNALEQRYHRARKMVGVLPIGSISPNGPATCAYFWSLKRGELEAWRAGGLARWKDEARALWPQTEGLLEQIVDPEQLTFAAYGHSTMRQPFGSRVAHVGDAFHSTSPQLGQGANMALLDAMALDQAFARHEGRLVKGRSGASDGPEEGALRAVFDDYARSRRRHVAFYQAASRSLTPFYQSDRAALSLARDHLAGPLARSKPVAAMLARLVAGVAVSPFKGFSA